nr:hypothetical protein [Tanacetum cinerariifolium]
MEDLKQQYLDEVKRLSNLEYRDEIKIAELKKNLNATESDEVIKSSVENLSPIPSESEGIPEHMCDVPFNDNSPPLDASPLDSELVSSEVMEIIIPEVGGIDDDILLTIKDDILQISSGSTTTHSDISLPEYEVFHDDHVKEISSGSPTTHSDSSLYASFIFDLSINPFPPADRSDFYEFTDEFIPFISPPDYDCFLFKVEPTWGIVPWMWWRIFLQEKNQKFLMLHANLIFDCKSAKFFKLSPHRLAAWAPPSAIVSPSSELQVKVEKKARIEQGITESRLRRGSWQLLIAIVRFARSSDLVLAKAFVAKVVVAPASLAIRKSE